MARHLLLNVAEISVDEAEVSASVLPFESGDQLRDLRRKHGTTHVFKRAGESILCVPTKSGAEHLGSADVPLRLHDNLGLCAALVRNAMLDHLAGLQREITGVHPIRFLANVERNEGENLLAASVPQGTVCPPWLIVRPLYEMDVRVLNVGERRPLIAAALNVRTKRRIAARCDHLIAAGLDLRGLYVAHHVPEDDPRLAPALELVGRVMSIGADGHLRLDDHRERYESVNAKEVYLSAARDAFDRCLGLVFGKDAARVSQALEGRLISLKSGSGRLNKLRRVLEYFRGVELVLLPGVRARFGHFIDEHHSDNFPQVSAAPKPVYVFDFAGTKTDTWHDGGLAKYGPYSGDYFTPNRPRICVICQASKKGQVDQFLHKFLHGMRQSGRDRMPFTSGLIRKYALEGVTHEFFLAEGRSADAYRKAVREALERQREVDARWDLALVQTEEAFHDLSGDANPYLVVKASFLAQQVSVQEFEIETVTVANEKQLGYSLNNMALASYAKLGGVPWLIRADRTKSHELVIGLGSTFIGEGRLGSRERVVGITTVFTGDGNYQLSSLSKAVPMDDYPGELISSLRASVEKAQRSSNWQKGEHVRLVFHVFKPLRDAEVDAVKAVMASLGEYDVDFAFLHVVDDHPFLAFDQGQPGITTFGSQARKGTLAPTRGWYFDLSATEVLLCLTGARELKRPEDGMPWPILLRLHRGSNFKDMTYLTRQVFTFASHSWRSFFPSSLPVTVLYSNLVARLLGELSPLRWWNPDALLGRIGETRWFL